MYELTVENAYFCCEPGQIGVLPVNGYAGLCEPTDQSVASSLIATPASQVGGAPVTSIAGEGAGSAATTTSSSTSQSTGGSSNSGSSSSGGSSSGITAALHKVHLTIGAIVGIAVGGVAVICVVLLLLWKCCCASQRRISARAVEPYRSVNEGYPQPEYAAPVQEYKEPNVGIQVQGGAYGGQGYGAGRDWNTRVEMGQ
jgi:hypothetical protein